MPAERTPPDPPPLQQERSLLARPMMAMTSWIMRHPVTVLAVAVALSVVAIVTTIDHLGFRTSRIDLINPDNAYNKLYLEFTEEFGEENEVVVVVEGDSRDRVVPVLDAISTELERNNHLFHAVLHELDFSGIRRKGLHYARAQELESIEQFVQKTEPIMRGGWERLAIRHMLEGVAMRLANFRRDALEYRNAIAELDRLSVGLRGALGDEGRYSSPWPSTLGSLWPEMPGLVATVSDLDSPYLVTDQGQTGFVFLQLANPDRSQFAQGTEAIAKLRELADWAERRHPGVKVGLTGLPIMENDEMQESQSAMTKASVLSLFGVACLFVAGLGGLRHPMMTVAALLVALCWSLGYITLAVGHLNILSVSFGVILIGLGIDFGIHYVARYLQLRGQIRSPRQCVIQTAGGVGPGIITGAITTAIAFFAAGLTEFTGVAELGLIAGGGVLLCCAAALILLPAMIWLSDSNRLIRVLPTPLDVHGAIKPIFAYPRMTLGATLLLTALIACGISGLWYDHNLLNLQPEGLESVELEHKLLEQYAQSVSYAVSITDSREELMWRRERFSQLGSVSSVSEIASAIPTDSEAKRPAIMRIAKRLANLPERPGVIPVQSPGDLGRQLAEIDELLSGDPAVMPIRRNLDEIRNRLRRLSDEECNARVGLYQRQMAGDLVTRLMQLRSMADPEPPQWSDLPPSLVTRFIGKEGNYLLKIHPQGNIWDMDELERFVREVRSVDMKATGNPIQTYEASRSMQKSYQTAAAYALVAIVVVLMFDFRSVKYVLLAMVPLAFGTLQMFGILGVLGIPLNPANMIVLPLILGIGIDDGVHVVHDYRNQAGRYHMSPSTASSVLLTSLTTMVGFGSLMIARHRGLQSLGQVLTIGVSCCLFTSLIMLPAFLAWLSRNRDDAQSTPRADAVGARIRRHGVHRRDWERLHDSHDADHPPGTHDRKTTGAETSDRELRQ